MDTVIINDVEIRIIGCLIEKEITTPEYYPLTLNALVNACNQKSNRSPVVSYDETAAVRGLDRLQEIGFSEKIYKADSRVPKYQQLFSKKMGLSRRELAVMCELMLRGPQTPGELRGRADRMYQFEGIGEVEEILNELMAREKPLVIKLPRQAGRKESRYAHLLSGEPEIEESESQVPEETATLRVRAENERIAKLESDVVALRRDFDDLKKQFTDLKNQLE